jgi:hypothetical protein
VINTATQCSRSCQSRWDQLTPVVDVKGMKAENPANASVRLSTAPRYILCHCLSATHGLAWSVPHVPLANLIECDKRMPGVGNK